MSPSLRTALASPDGKRRYVRTLFSTIADRYDLITRLLSYGQDRHWKRRVVALACSEPPADQTRWTLKLLAQKLVDLELVDSISEVAVYKRLKKRTQTLAGQVLVHRR